jgi:hypothetical protein
MEYFTWLSAKPDSIVAMPSSRVSLGLATSSHRALTRVLVRHGTETVTRRNVAGMDVLSLVPLLF